MKTLASVLLLFVGMLRAQQATQLVLGSTPIFNQHGVAVQYVFGASTGSTYYPSKQVEKFNLKPCAACIEFQTSYGVIQLFAADDHEFCKAGCSFTGPFDSFHSEEDMDFTSLGPTYVFRVLGHLVGTFVDPTGKVWTGVNARYSFETTPEAYSESLSGVNTSGGELVIELNLN